jgi:hypothetical protein
VNCAGSMGSVSVTPLGTVLIIFSMTVAQVLAKASALARLERITVQG